MRTITNPDNYRSPDYRQILRIEKTGQSITESSVLEGSFTFDSTMVEGDVFQIGTAIADQITVTLTEDLDIDSYYDIYISALQSGAARNTATWVKLGTYVIAEMDTSFEGQTKVVFQDKLITLDESVLLNTGTLYANLTAMATVSLTQEEITFLSGISVANAQTMTKRDFIRGCGLLMWENAYITSSGAVSYRVKTTTAQSFDSSVRFNSSLADPVTIGPVDVVDDSGAVIFTRGSSSGQRIVIDNSTSPMINLIGGVENLAQYYSTATIPGRGIVDFEYTPLTMTAMSSWQMEPGDVFTYVDKNSVSHTSICTSVAHVLNGASACTSAAKSKQRQSKLIPSQTDEARAIVENLSSGIDIAQSTASEAMPKYGTCTTAASTVTKSVTGISNFNLQLGTRVSLLMTNSNTANEPKLNVNSTGAKYIVTSDGSKLTTSTNGIKAWLAGSMVTFVYTRNNDDTDYVWRIDDNYALTRINHIWADTLTGTNGSINLSEGTFDYGSGKLTWDGSIFQVSGWNIGANLLSNTVTIDNTEYLIYMQSVNGTTRVNAFGVNATTSGTTVRPFYVTYDGSMHSEKGTIGGWTIGADQLSSSATVNSTTYTAYVKAFSSDYYGTAFGVSEGSSTVFAVNYTGQVVASGVASSKLMPRNDTNPKIIVATEIQSPAYDIYMSGTEVGTLRTKYGISSSTTNPKLYAFLNGAQASVSIPSADGEVVAVSPGTTSQNLLTTALSLEANHRYCISYIVQWAANSSGRRFSGISIGGNDVGIIASDHRAAMSAGVTICRGEYWIPSSSSARSLQITGWQNGTTNTTLNATIRYQLIDFGV